MKKKIGIIIAFIIIVIAIIISMILVNNNKNKDALAFKKEYEAINGKANINGLEHRTVSINKKNPFVKVTGDDIVNKIENKESFFVYFGDDMCPWCRSVIEKAIEVANEKNITKIYYVKIWEGDHNEVFRDKYELNDDGSLKLVSKGSDSYYKIIKYFDNVLSDYTLTNTNGDKIEVGEKRIFAPNFIYVSNGEAIKLVEGISEKQKDAREKFTDEILNDETSIFEDFYSTPSLCSDTAC